MILAVPKEILVHEASRKWTKPIRNWKSALNHFAILFEDRLSNELC